MRYSRRAVVRQAVALALVSGTRSAIARPTRFAFRRGVNLWPWFSLTREFPAPREDYAWPPFQDQRPVPRTSDLVRLRAAGFDFVRIPVDPGPFMAAPARQRTEPALQHRLVRRKMHHAALTQ